MQENDTLTINVGGLYYRILNRHIRASLLGGVKKVILRNVLGQRYIGGGVEGNITFHVHGIPGQNLGAFMNGPQITIFGNAQDGVGNTMNEGKIIVHGKAGEIPCHSMRGGKVFIRGDVEYRAAIHMKEYINKTPWLVIGGTAKDFCGEYMAGGKVVVLNLEDRKKSPVGYGLGTGIHGGTIYIRGAVKKYQLGVGAVFSEMEASDVEFLMEALEEYGRDCDINLNGISPNEFLKITKKGYRPFGSLYTPGMNVKTLEPRHFNLTPPCTFNCPTGIPTPVFFNLIKEGKIKEAQLLMDEYTPFRMSVCGTVCPAPCMDACNRNSIDGPVQIQELARRYYPDRNPKVQNTTRGKTIAIVGAGPAGLSAAWQLARRGYRVSVFDAMDDVGGKVRKAIPRERLSDELLEKDIKRIESLPITFHLGERIDRQTFQDIYAASDAILVATGAHVTKRIQYPGGERIASGLSFLVDINEGRPMKLDGKHVVIIGAGNVGMDIACEAWRLDAEKVTALDVQKPLAFGKELELAEKFGTEILWPRFIEKLSQQTICFTDGTRIRADVVLFSIGEMPDASFIPDTVFFSEHGYMVTGEKSFRSSDPKVYGCGDIVKPGLITDAIGSGRLAAMEIHATLNREEFVWPERHLVPRRRIQTLYFGGEEEEIDRCMSCGTCIFCDICIENCPQKALSRNGEIFTIDSERCTLCYTCVNVCPRGAIQTELLHEMIKKKATA